MEDFKKLIQKCEHDGSFIPVNEVKRLMNAAYNQCLKDLIADDILPDKVVNFIKYSKYSKL